MDNMLFEFMNLAFSLIISDTPVDTRNLLNNTRFEINGNEATIIVSAPKATKKGYDNYAPYVNYNKQRSFKERKNYHYVERNLVQAAQIIAERYGGVVINEL